MCGNNNGRSVILSIGARTSPQFRMLCYLLFVVARLSFGGLAFPLEKFVLVGNNNKWPERKKRKRWPAACMKIVGTNKFEAQKRLIEFGFFFFRRQSSQRYTRHDRINP